jgi:hypothetical protein
MEKCLTDQRTDSGTTRATASLPGLEIEIVHRKSQEADAEAISINLQAVPSFEAFGKFIETTNPFAVWAQVVPMVWFLWLGATSALMLPWSGGRVRLNSPGSPNATNEQTQR